MGGTLEATRGKGALAGFMALAGALALAGCADASGPAPGATAQAVSFRPSGASPSPAALAVTQMEGAPTQVQKQFMALFNADVVKDDVTLTNSASARYLARGYISAFPVEGGARLTYVWDIYDRANHRAQRLNDEIALKGAAADPWSLVDGAALQALAERSAGELSAYLSNTPEALAANAAQAAPQSLPAKALSYSDGR
ncbi:hypothetical protein [uncultured Rhodoblastus sp.]|uniref:hypothetical protein n=1 Tax=uncultured Rhodoblastus sp. TaxID=543037 RepID=UPI0025FC1C45|nr:hypothetical protein [uncultured Rhodoblastus sp.]